MASQKEIAMHPCAIENAQMGPFHIDCRDLGKTIQSGSLWANSTAVMRNAKGRGKGKAVIHKSRLCHHDGSYFQTIQVTMDKATELPGLVQDSLAIIAEQLQHADRVDFYPACRHGRHRAARLPASFELHCLSICVASENQLHLRDV